MRDLVAIDWWALLSVAVVTVAAASFIAALMSLANWLLTPTEGRERPTRERKIAGLAVIVMMGIAVLVGIWLIIPYFH